LVAQNSALKALPLVLIAAGSHHAVAVMALMERSRHGVSMNRMLRIRIYQEAESACTHYGST
jgi:hypothetical protein